MPFFSAKRHRLTRALPTAQSIEESLLLLASLRPQTADTQTLAPPAHALRQLHRTLPVGPTPGWHGTLPDARARALVDDTTVHVKSDAALPAPTAPATPVPPPPSTPAAAAKMPATPVGTPYSYTAFPTYAGGTYRPGAATPYSYAPGASAGSYYAYSAPGAAATDLAQQYGLTAAAQWAARGQAAGAQWYTAAAATPGRAVANTITPAKTYAGWQGANAGYTPTLARASSWAPPAQVQTPAQTPGTPGQS
jgi:hypothetical protein